MLDHSTDTHAPEFKFRIIASYPDPLRRQLCEGIEILNSGTLNRRLEFNRNDICRMISSTSAWDLEREINNQTVEREKLRRNVNNFVAVMSNLSNVSGASSFDEMSNQLKINSRIPPHRPEPKPKRIRMETSTPKTVWSRREGYDPVGSPDTSPVGKLVQLPGSSENSSGGTSLIGRERTGVSLEFLDLQVTPPRKETSSQYERSLFRGAINLTNAAVRTGVITRSRSLDNMADTDPIELNCMYKELVKIRQHEEDLARGIENMSLPTGEVLEEEGNDALNIEDNAVLINTVSVDDGLKNEVLVIPEGEEIHTRPSCCREEVSGNPKLGVIILGGKAEDTLLQEKATPDSSSVKRALKVSPDTLVGRTRKVSIGESSPVVREITSSELVRSYSCSGQERSGARGWRKIEDGIARSLSFLTLSCWMQRELRVQVRGGGDLTQNCQGIRW